MRTDCELNTDETLRLPQIPLGSPGKLTSAGRGDFIAWEIGGNWHTGRIIGVVRASNLDTPHFCVAMQLRNIACERWVHPNEVLDSWRAPNEWEIQKMAWLYGPDFLVSEPDKARQCFDLLASEL